MTAPADAPPLSEPSLERFACRARPDQADGALSAGPANGAGDGRGRSGVDPGQLRELPRTFQTLIRNIADDRGWADDLIGYPTVHADPEIRRPQLS